MQVAVAVVGPGNGGAAVLAERVFTMFEPRALLFVGVAGALSSTVQLDDVVVATRVYAVDGGHEDYTGFHVRPRAWDAPHELEQLARFVSRGDWRSALAAEPVAVRPRSTTSPRSCRSRARATSSWRRPCERRCTSAASSPSSSPRPTPLPWRVLSPTRPQQLSAEALAAADEAAGLFTTASADRPLAYRRSVLTIAAVRAQALLAQDRVGETQQVCVAALAAVGDADLPFERGDVLLICGHACKVAGDHESARALLTEAVETYPRTASPRGGPSGVADRVETARQLLAELD